MEAKKSEAVSEGAQVRDLAQVTGMLPILDQTLPNNESGDADRAVTNIDPQTYRDVDPQRGVAVSIDGRDYPHTINFAGYTSKITPDRTPMIGVHEMIPEGEEGKISRLFVTVEPTRPFMSLGLNEVDRVLSERDPPEKYNRNNKDHQVLVSQYALTNGGSEYRNDYLRATKPTVIIVLGKQKDGEFDNASAYEALREDNKRYRESQGGETDLRENNWVPVRPGSHIYEMIILPNPAIANDQPIRVFHVDFNSSSQQNLDSVDWEILTDIHELEGTKALHCKDGRDRAGFVTLAFSLLNQYDSLIIPGNPDETKANIENERRRLKDIRGGGFCTAHEHRVLGALEMATIMKAIKVTRDQLKEVQQENPALYQQLEGKGYLAQIHILREQNNRSELENQLLSNLEARADTEVLYYKLVSAEEADHPQARQWESERKSEREKVLALLSGKSEKVTIGTIFRFQREKKVSAAELEEHLNRLSPSDRMNTLNAWISGLDRSTMNKREMAAKIEKIPVKYLVDYIIQEPKHALFLMQNDRVRERLVGNRREFSRLIQQSKPEMCVAIQVFGFLETKSLEPYYKESFAKQLQSRIQKPISEEQKQFIIDHMKGDRGQLNERNLAAFLDLYPDNSVRLEVLRELFLNIQKQDYAKPVFSELLRRTLAPETSTVRNGHIEILKNACLDILEKNKKGMVDNQEVLTDSQVSSVMDLLNYETRLITLDPRTREAMRAIDRHQNNPQTAIKMLFAVTPEGQSPFNAYSLIDIIGKRLYNPAKAISTIDIEQIADYMRVHPKHAGFFLEPRSRFLGGRDFIGELLSREGLLDDMIESGSLHLYDVILESSMLDDKRVSQVDKFFINKKLNDSRNLLVQGHVNWILANPDKAKERLQDEHLMRALLKYENQDSLIKLLTSAKTVELINAIKEHPQLILKLIEISDIEAINKLHFSLIEKIPAEFKKEKELLQMVRLQREFSPEAGYNIEEGRQFEKYYNAYQKYIANMEYYAQKPAYKVLIKKAGDVHNKNTSAFKEYYRDNKDNLMIKLLGQYPNKQIQEICRSEDATAAHKINRLMDRYAIDKNDHNKYQMLMDKVFAEKIDLSGDTELVGGSRPPYEQEMYRMLEFIAMAEFYKVDRELRFTKVAGSIDSLRNYVKAEVFIQKEKEQEIEQSFALSALLEEDAVAMEGSQAKPIEPSATESRQGLRYDKNSDRTEQASVALSELSAEQRAAMMVEAVKKTHHVVKDELTKPPASVQSDSESAARKGAGNINSSSGATLILCGVVMSDTQDESGQPQKTAEFSAASLGDSSGYYFVRDKRTGLVSRGERLNKRLHSTSDPNEIQRLREKNAELDVKSGAVRVGMDPTTVTSAFGMMNNNAVIRREPEISARVVNFNPETEELLFVAWSDGVAEGLAGNHQPVDAQYAQHVINEYSRENPPDTTLAQYFLQKAREHIPPYKLALITEQSAMEKGTFYVEKTQEGLRYKVMDAAGQTQEGVVTPKGLKYNRINERGDTIRHSESVPWSSKVLADILKEPFSLDQIRPLLPEILALTSNIGHTQSLKSRTTDDSTVMVANLSEGDQLFCLCDGNGTHGNQVAQTAVTNLVRQCQSLTNQFAEENRLTAIQVASHEGRVEEVNLLLNQIDLKAKQGRNALTLMEFAIQTSDTALAKALIEKGAPLDAKNAEWKTSVMIAVEYGSIGVVQDLLEAGAKIDTVDDAGQTPLYKAVIAGNTAMVKCLLDHGANPSALCNNQETKKPNDSPLKLAERKNQSMDTPSEILDLLQEAQKQPRAQRKPGWTAQSANQPVQPSQDIKQNRATEDPATDRGSKRDSGRK